MHIVADINQTFLYLLCSRQTYRGTLDPSKEIESFYRKRPCNMLAEWKFMWSIITYLTWVSARFMSYTCYLRTASVWSIFSAFRLRRWEAGADMKSFQALPPPRQANKLWAIACSGPDIYSIRNRCSCNLHKWSGGPVSIPHTTTLVYINTIAMMNNAT